MSSPPIVVMVSSPETLAGIDPGLRRAGVRLVRAVSVVPSPIPANVWTARLGGAANVDTVVVTSRAAVEAGIEVWRHARGRLPPLLEYWAVGPGTVAALRRVGIRRVHRPRTMGSSSVVASLRRTPFRKVVYFRSDVAGPELARALRRQGHQVVDLIVYRVVSPPRLSVDVRRALPRADLLVVTSPSGFLHLRRGVGTAAFSRLAESTPVVVLGERSRRAALDHGFRRASVAPSLTAQRFTRYLLGELRNVRA